MLKQLSNQKGFTLVEMVISIAIISIISAVTFSGLNESSEFFALRDATRQTADLYRKAQSFAINVRADQLSDYSGRYGVFSRYYLTESGEQSEVIFYSDQNGNDTFDGTYGDCDDECEQRLTFGRGISIVEINQTDTTDFTQGSDNSDILFIRPNVDAIIKTGPSDPPAKQVEIVLENRLGQRESVIIGATGYIFSTE